jgi:hypothetical protein
LTQSVFSELSHKLLHFNGVTAEEIREVLENIVDDRLFFNLVVQVKDVKYLFHVLFKINAQ